MSLDVTLAEECLERILRELQSRPATTFCDAVSLLYAQGFRGRVALDFDGGSPKVMEFPAKEVRIKLG